MGAGHEAKSPQQAVMALGTRGCFTLPTTPTGDRGTPGLVGPGNEESQKGGEADVQAGVVRGPEADYTHFKDPVSPEALWTLDSWTLGNERV